LRLRVLSLLCFAILFVFIGSSKATPFDCASADCILNGTTNLWTCTYSDCPKQPNWTVISPIVVNVTNVTYELNVTNYTVANYTCDDTDFLISLSEFMVRFNDTLAMSDKYFACNQTLSTCVGASDRISADNNILRTNLSRTIEIYDSCVNRLSNATYMASQESIRANSNQTYITYAFIAPFILVGLAWWLTHRHPSLPDRTIVEPTQGQTSYNAKAIDDDVSKERLKEDAVKEAVKRIRSDLDEKRSKSPKRKSKKITLDTMDEEAF